MCLPVCVLFTIVAEWSPGWWCLMGKFQQTRQDSCDEGNVRLNDGSTEEEAQSRQLVPEESVSRTLLSSRGCKAANDTVRTKNKHLLKTTAKYNSTLCSYLSNLPPNLVLYHHQPLIQLRGEPRTPCHRVVRDPCHPTLQWGLPVVFFSDAVVGVPNFDTRPTTAKGEKEKSRVLVKALFEITSLTSLPASLPSELF